MNRVARLGYSIMIVVIITILLAMVELGAAQETTLVVLSSVGFLLSVAGRSSDEG